MSEQLRSRQLGRLIDQAVIQAFSAEVDQIESIFESCESHLQSIVEGQFERDEVARRVAEAKVCVLYDRPGAEVAFRRAWVALEGLCFLSPEREATMLVFLIEFLSRAQFSARDEMSVALDRLAGSASRLADISPEASAHFRRVHDRLSRR